MEKLTYTVEQAAEVLGLSRSSMYEAVRSGSVPAIRVGGRWLISKVQLERFLSGEKCQPARAR